MRNSGMARRRTKGSVEEGGIGIVIIVALGGILALYRWAEALPGPWKIGTATSWQRRSHGPPRSAPTRYGCEPPVAALGPSSTRASCSTASS